MNKKTYILDPIHGQIEIKEIKIIESPLFQRLHNVKQLTAAHLVFPGGVHTRFSHSIGVSHIAEKYGEHLFPDDKHKIKLLRIAGLLHDIGHGFGSHSYDDIVYSKIFIGVKKGHDCQRIEIIKYMKSIVEEYGVDINDIINIWNNKNPLMHSIIQGDLGADRLDYLMRDSYFCGVQHIGTIPVQRLINNSLIKNNILHYNIKIFDDIKLTLSARYYMYKNIYYHKTSCSASIVINNILKYSIEPLNLIKRTKNIQKFILINDTTLIGEILANNKMKICQKYCFDYLHRKLPKLFWEKITTDYESDIVEKNKIINDNPNLIYYENKNIKLTTNIYLNNNGKSILFENIDQKTYHILRLYKTYYI